MTSFSNPQNDYFSHGDWRVQLDNWLKRNQSDEYRLRYIKNQTARFRMTEALSLDLVDRRYWGLKASELKHEIQACGKHGETQRKKESDEKRYLGYYCNLNNLHLDCAIRYRNMQGERMKRQYLEVMNANAFSFVRLAYFYI